MGASLSFLAAIPLVGEEGAIAKVAARGLETLEIAGKESASASKALKVLKEIDAEAKVAGVARQARLNLAAAIESKFLSREEAVASLTRQLGGAGGAAEADKIVAAAEREGADAGKELDKAKGISTALQLRRKVLVTFATRTYFDPHNNKPSLQAELFERDKARSSSVKSEFGKNFRLYSEAPEIY